MDITHIFADAAPSAKLNYTAGLTIAAPRFRDFGITTPIRIAGFLAQVLLETGGGRHQRPPSWAPASAGEVETPESRLTPIRYTLMPMPIILPSTADREAGADTPDALSRQRILTLVVVLAALWVVRGFLAPLAWAVVLAVAEWPLHRRLMARMPNRPALAALILTLGTALLVILPLSLVAVSLASESQAAIAWLQGVQQYGMPPPAWLGGLPLVGGKAAQAWQQHLGSPQAASGLLGGLSAGSVLGWVRSAAGAIASESGLFLITLVALFSMLAEGEGLARHARVVSRRLLGGFGGHFLEKLTVAVRGTVNGTVLVSVAEGVLIGVGYVIAGVPQPILFGTVTVALAMIPFGAWLVFGIATLILLGQGHVLPAILLFAGSVTVMTLGDNVVQPRVIGSTVELPFVLAILGTVGGLESLGLVGLFVGPVVMVALLLIWDQWMKPGEAMAAG